MLRAIHFNKWLSQSYQYYWQLSRFNSIIFTFIKDWQPYEKYCKTVRMDKSPFNFISEERSWRFGSSNIIASHTSDRQSLDIERTDTKCFNGMRLNVTETASEWRHLGNLNNWIKVTDFSRNLTIIRQGRVKNWFTFKNNQRMGK